MSAAVVAEAGARDAATVAALHAATIGRDGGPGENWDAAFMARVLALPGAAAYLAKAPLPVGFVLCLPAGAAMDVAAIGVLDAMRRRGVGRLLLAAAGVRAARTGAERLMLEVAADNAAAIAFYLAQGFREAGHRPAYYAAWPGQPPRAALVLVKPLRGEASFPVNTADQ